MTVEEVLDLIDKNATVPLWPHAGKALGLSRGQTYRSAKRGEIKTIGIGKIKRVATPWLRKKLETGDLVFPVREAAR